jgi:hypothetical protein
MENIAIPNSRSKIFSPEKQVAGWVGIAGNKR